MKLSTSVWNQRLASWTTRTFSKNASLPYYLLRPGKPRKGLHRPRSHSPNSLILSMDPGLEKHTQLCEPRPRRRPVVCLKLWVLVEVFVIDLTRCTQIRIDSTRMDVIRMRLGVKRRVEQAIQGTFGRKYTVEFFGSTRFALHTVFCPLCWTIVLGMVCRIWIAIWIW